jgi:hypothetical protein
MSSCSKDDGNNCSKVYVVPKAHSHGLIIVVCVCRHPKVIGVFVLPSAESLSIVASVLLKHFGVLPDVVFYDASCLLSYSISLRFPLLMSRTIFLTDRFHEEGHTCGPIYSARFRPQADGMRSSNAESINAIFASSRSHVRYLGEHHPIPFLFVKSMFMNLKARCRQSSGKADAEDVDLPPHSTSSTSAAARGATKPGSRSGFV